MQQIIKRYFWIGLLAAGLQSSWGFALLGPETLANGADSWQTAAIGYDLAYVDDSAIPGDPMFFGDIGGPRNYGEGYRRNTPVVYYTYDSTFINFFGTDGMTEVDQAFGIMNAVPPADKINLALYPDQSQEINYTAQADYLTDLKSVTLHLLVEQMGLADPERFAWTLHDRILPPGGVCLPGGFFGTGYAGRQYGDMMYTVVQRNYADQPTASNVTQYSYYINDVMYSYWLEETCTPGPVYAWTVPFAPDANALNYQAVAANAFDGYGLQYLQGNLTVPTALSGGLQVGSFYTGLTRDDVAGFVYLYHTNHVDLELPDPTAVTFTVVTNVQQQALFPAVPIASNGTNSGFYTYDGTYGYGDYGQLIATALTNSPAVLQLLYPGIAIANSYSYFVHITNYTYTLYFTNQVGAQYPAPPILVTVTNQTLGLQERYATTFQNVFAFTNHALSKTILQTITVSQNIGAQYPAPTVTNTTSQTVKAAVPSGYFIVLPRFQTNVCPLDFLYTGLTNVLSVTNLQSAATNTLVTATNTTTTSSTLQTIYYFTNYTWVVHPVTCGNAAGVANLYQGIGKVQFQRADYDSEFSQYFDPITNYYNMVVLTNYQWLVQPFFRVVTQPDILLNAVDEGEANTFIGTVFRDINFTPSPILGGLAGPGTINNSPVTGAPVTFSYDKIGNSVWNGWDIQTYISDLYLDQRQSIPALAWASYGASTNAPELYPNGTSIQNLENQLVVNLSPVSPPNGSVGSGYSVQFTASGGGFTPPFTWSYTGAQITTGLFYGLPPGLVLSSSGQISGTPTTAGTYDFALTLSDNAQPASHVVTWNLSITIQ